MPDVFPEDDFFKPNSLVKLLRDLDDNDGDREGGL